MLAQHQTIILSKWVEVTIVGLLDLFHSSADLEISSYFNSLLSLVGISTTSHTSRLIKITDFYISSEIYRIQFKKSLQLDG